MVLDLDLIRSIIMEGESIGNMEAKMGYRDILKTFEIGQSGVTQTALHKDTLARTAFHHTK
jgi:hypothetical protein